MIAAALIVAGSALGILLWHMQRPRPPLIAVSFVRFVPGLPPAPARRSRVVLARPRDVLALLCLLAMIAFALWALIDTHRSGLAARPDHIGLRIVVDVSHSMSVADGGGSRLDLALARIEAARGIVAGSGANSTCVELTTVAATAQPAVALPVGAALPELAPLPEGAEPLRLVAAATAPVGDCPLTHALVVTDAPTPGIATRETGPLLIWDQVGAPVANAGIRRLALGPQSLGQAANDIRIDGIYSGSDWPETLVLRGPAGVQEVQIWSATDAVGRWQATAAHVGAGAYEAVLPGADGYGGDDIVRVQIAPATPPAADWRLSVLPRPPVLAQGAADALLVAEIAAVTPAEMSRPVLLTWPAFEAPSDDRQIGTFRDDAILLAVNFDALEAVLPAPLPGVLPDGFVPVLTDSNGGVLAARREQPPGVLVPAPRPDAPEPQRSLSLTLFFSALADLVMMPPQDLPLVWSDAEGRVIADAWRESGTARALGEPAQLDLLARSGTAETNIPLWPWLVLAAMVSLLAERLLRLARRFEAIP